MRPETEHIIQVLKTAMRVLGFTKRGIEQKLGVSGGYLTRLFNGTMELRFEHIVDIARAMGLEPEEVFHLAYPQPRLPPTESAQRIRDAFGGPATVPQPSAAPEKPAPPPANPESSALASALEQDMERLMMKMFRKLFAETMARSAGE